MKQHDLKQIRECAWELDREAQGLNSKKHPSNKLLKHMEGYAKELAFLCWVNQRPKPKRKP